MVCRTICILYESVVQSSNRASVAVLSIPVCRNRYAVELNMHDTLYNMYCSSAIYTIKGLFSLQIELRWRYSQYQYVEIIIKLTIQK